MTISMTSRALSSGLRQRISKTILIARSPLTVMNAATMTTTMHTTRRAASSLPNIPETLKSSPLFAKLRDSPILMAEIIKLTALFERKGIKMDAGKPSFTDMMTLARDGEVQDAMGRLKRVMDEQGVTVDVQALLKNMPK